MPPSFRWRRGCSLTFEPPLSGTCRSPPFSGRVMPAAGIPLRPSFVRSIHARIARPRPFTRVQQRRSGRRTPMKRPHRRQFLHLTAGAAALPMASWIARAQAYPTRPVRLVVPAPAGGSFDITARLMGQWLSERLGQPFVIENRPGAGTNIGTEAVVRAPADGYTLLMVGTAQAINATIYDKLNFNFIRDIAPIAGIIREPNVMVLNPSVPAKTVPDFIAYAKANPRKINMASSGKGSSPHVAGELFRMMIGVDMNHVPYRGAAPALTDLLAGQVDVMFATMPSSIEYVRTGKLRALAVTTAMRSDAFPEISDHR